MREDFSVGRDTEPFSRPEEIGWLTGAPLEPLTGLNLITMLGVDHRFPRFHPAWPVGLRRELVENPALDTPEAAFEWLKTTGNNL